MCLGLLADPSNLAWSIAVTDQGQMQTIRVFKYSPASPVPQIRSTSTTWNLSIDSQGRLVATATSANPSAPNSVVLTSAPSGTIWTVTITDAGFINFQQGGFGGNDPVPGLKDVSMSNFPRTAGVTCAACGNATVTVMADFRCWCCTCNQFVDPNDTNIVVILDE